jgi:hypothetical protein
LVILCETNILSPINQWLNNYYQIQTKCYGALRWITRRRGNGAPERNARPVARPRIGSCHVCVLESKWHASFTRPPKGLSTNLSGSHLRNPQLPANNHLFPLTTLLKLVYVHPPTADAAYVFRSPPTSRSFSPLPTREREADDDDDLLLLDLVVRSKRTSRYWSSGLEGQQRGICLSLPRADAVLVSSRLWRCSSSTGEDVEGGEDKSSAVSRFPSFQCISWSVELGFVESAVAQSRIFSYLPWRLPFLFIALHERGPQPMNGCHAPDQGMIKGVWLGRWTESDEINSNTRTSPSLQMVRRQIF